MKAVPQKLRDDMYYEALEEVDTTIESIEAFLIESV